MVVQDEFKVGFGRRRESKRWHISASPSLSPVIADTDKTPATAALHTRDAQVLCDARKQCVVGEGRGIGLIYIEDKDAWGVWRVR